MTEVKSSAGAADSTALQAAAPETTPQQAPAEAPVEAHSKDSMPTERQAMPSRPERPMSARRGPPKLPGTGSAGQAVLCWAVMLSTVLGCYPQCCAGL